MHDSLLEHKPEESLSKDEINKAWEEYENEKKGIFTHMRQNVPPPANWNNMNQQFYNRNTLNALIDTPNWLHGLNVSND
jgi:hypothetical protein